MAGVVDLVVGPDGKIDVNRAIILPVWWIKYHIELKNLQITQDINSMLDDPKLSVRLFGEMLLALSGGYDPWGVTAPVGLFDLDSKTFKCIRLHTNDDGTTSGDDLTLIYGERGVMLPYYTYWKNKENHIVMMGAWNGTQELRINRDYDNYFQRKFPYRLKSKSPLYGAVTGNLEVVPPRKR